MLSECYYASFIFKYSTTYLSYVIKQNSAIVVRTHSLHTFIIPPFTIVLKNYSP